MDKVGILLVSKCLSSSAMVDTFLRSQKYRPEFYVIERQLNPFNHSRAKFHAVVPTLALGEIVKIARRFRDSIAFGLTDTEDFVVAGGRDAVEKEAGVPMVCVTKKYAVERSKADQRLLFDAIFREANPDYRVFDPRDYPDSDSAMREFRKTAAGMDAVVVKPDAPARGAGVGVWGSDFESEEEMSSFFLNVLSKGRVVVERKVEGEESSFHAFSDGKHFHPAPLTRDYKRALDENRGRLTGGMGSYRSKGAGLPFLTYGESERLSEAEEDAFRRWRGRGSEPGLRGIVLYDAIMHTGRGFKVLERNSRGGNTEVVNLLATLADDLVDVCYRTVEGSLKQLRFKSESSVVTCAVPNSYGGAGDGDEGSKVDLAAAYALAERQGGRLRILPMDLREEDGATRMGTSRTVAVAALAGSLAEAREISLRGVEAISGPLRWRKDIASAADLARSAAHMRLLRRRSRLAASA
ncbi:MAG: hypothetical protein E6K84_07360 [Thaumarchaeota archaeon]|nr:MAG: hypothetical protein E6K84_07360 [Nitrososphaerota archaeon]